MDIVSSLAMITTMWSSTGNDSGRHSHLSIDMTETKMRSFGTA